MTTFSLQYFAWLEFVIFVRFKAIKVDWKRIQICRSASLTLGPVSRKMVKFNLGLRRLSQVLSKQCRSSMQLELTKYSYTVGPLLPDMVMITQNVIPKRYIGR